MERLSMSSPSRAIVGEPAPRFKCKCIIDGRVKELSLSSLLNAHQWTILIFFPQAWSFICPGEIQAFNERRHEFMARGSTVLFASCDSEHVLKAWNSTATEEGGLGNVSIPLISDRSHRLTRDYGVLIEEEGMAQRAMFIIDPTGVIRGANINDVNVGRSVDEARRTLDALKFSDEFGEGCPVDWKSGQKGVQMDWSDVEHEQPESLKSQMVSNPAPSGKTRPQFNRGSSWNAGWGRAVNMRPKTWGGGNGTISENGTPTKTTPTEGIGLSTLLWGSNEDAVNVNHSVAI